MADHRSLAPANLLRHAAGLSSSVQTVQPQQNGKVKNVSGATKVTGPALSRARPVMFGGPHVMAGPLALAKGLAPRQYGKLAILSSLMPGLAAYADTLPQGAVATMPPLPLTPINRATRGYIAPKRGATRLGIPVEFLSLDEPGLSSDPTPGSAGDVTKSLTEREAMSQVSSAMAPVEARPLANRNLTTLGDMARAYLDPNLNPDLNLNLSRKLMMTGVVGGIR